MTNDDGTFNDVELHLRADWHRDWEDWNGLRVLLYGLMLEEDDRLVAGDVPDEDLLLEQLMDDPPCDALALMRP